MKKTTKSAALGKKFWICGALLGICLLCLVALSLFQSDKAREQADLLGIVNYVKIQCATYTHYNEACPNPKACCAPSKAPVRSA